MGRSAYLWSSLIAGVLVLAVSQGGLAQDCNQDGIDDSLQLVTCGLAFSAERSYAPGGLPIPDYNFTGISSTIAVTEAVQICKLRVHLNIPHTRPGQLVLKLRHENSGTEIVIIDLMANPTPHAIGGECGLGLDVVLDDSASQSIEFEWHTPCDSQAWIVRTYHPSPQLFALFNGETSAGDWTLNVCDVKPNYTGSLMSWSIDFYGQVDNDCNDNGVPDECDIDPDWDGTAEFDCNGNGRLDACDIASGYSQDANSNGVPDECDAPPVCRGDSNCDGQINWRDIDYFVAAISGEQPWRDMFLPGAPSCPYGSNDVNADGTVNWRDIDPFVAVMGTNCP